MPRSREALPVSALCLYREGNRRCRRIATVNGELCRHHAIRLELELERDHPLDDVIEAVDRHIARNPDPFVTMVTGMFGRIFGRANPAPAPPQPPRPQAQRPQQQRARPRPAPAPDPLLLARELLGFDPAELLTVEKVQKRKQALARVFHPDLPGGSENRMKRINHAADLLLAKL